MAKKQDNKAKRPAHNHDNREEEAQRIIDRVNRETETVGTSSMLKASNRVRDHLGAADVDQDNRIEVLGTRIGRTLGLLFFIGLLIYMLKTYVFTG